MVTYTLLITDKYLYNDNSSGLVNRMVMYVELLLSVTYRFIEYVRQSMLAAEFVIV